MGSDEEAIQAGRRYLAYYPRNWGERPPLAAPMPARPPHPLEGLVPDDEGRAFNMQHLIDGIVDEGSFFEIKPLYAREIICGLARLDGRPIGVVANQPMVKGGILFVDSADKAARFIWLCDAFNLPLLFLADVPGFMIGSAVERQGIIRHGAKLITSVSEATVPNFSVVVRKAYGAGLYAMAVPGFLPRAYLLIWVTEPAPTVRPPSRMAKRIPFSTAIGVISSISISMLSPGITISVPSGSLMEPVTSVVRM